MFVRERSTCGCSSELALPGGRILSGRVVGKDCCLRAGVLISVVLCAALPAEMTLSLSVMFVLLRAFAAAMSAAITSSPRDWRKWRASLALRFCLRTRRALLWGYFAVVWPASPATAGLPPAAPAAA